jgi:predicted aspartyl protease
LKKKKKLEASFIKTKSNHIIIKCFVNKIEGRFIVDTGASNSCINQFCSEKFNINYIKYPEKGSSATNYIDNMFYSKKNKIEIAGLIINDVEILLFNMTQINKSFREINIENIDGIIGGDILVKFNAKINYKKNKLSLKL